MLRPWWFPEYTPDQQAIFDKILSIIQNTFDQHNYQHIYTPAVEPIDILKKWWDIIDQQVFGLYWLAQWPQDTKDYALHFDLTIPLARYILDHRNILTFPFRRYQIQPVRRWESTKRWRYKEFWQFDVDTIWYSDTNIWTRYDIETISIIDKTMTNICQKFDININKILKISHISLTKNFLKSNWLDDECTNLVLKLLDNYYKIKKEEFEKKLYTILQWSNIIEKNYLYIYDTILKLIDSKNPSDLYIYEWYSDLQTIIQWLEELGIKYEYDVCIVRGQNYYKWMVCEWMDIDDISLWSLAWWGRYDGITDFIDSKQSFSGVGASLGRFVTLAMEKILTKDISKSEDKYIFINFGTETRSDLVRLYQSYISQWKICEIYPTNAKLSKQFEYADRKKINHAIILWSDEKNKWIYKIKNLIDGIQTDIIYDN